MEAEYPYVSFHFRVLFEGLKNTAAVDCGFQSVSGIGAEFIFDQNEEGRRKERNGKNPAKINYSPLVLSRGAVSINDSALVSWIADTLNKSVCKPVSKVTVELLGESHQPIMSWSFYHVLPKSWKLVELNAQRNEVLFETLELTYSSMTFNQLNKEKEK